MHMTKMIKCVYSEVVFFCPYSALTRSASLFAQHLDLVHNWCEPYLHPLLRLRYLYLGEPRPGRTYIYIRLINMLHTRISIAKRYTKIWQCGKWPPCGVLLNIILQLRGSGKISLAQRDSETKCPVSISVYPFRHSWKVEGIPFEKKILAKSDLDHIYLKNRRNWTKTPNQFPKLCSDLKIKHPKSRVLFSTFILSKMQDLKFQLKDIFFCNIDWHSHAKNCGNFSWQNNCSGFLPPHRPSRFNHESTRHAQALPGYYPSVTSVKNKSVPSTSSWTMLPLKPSRSKCFCKVS